MISQSIPWRFGVRPFQSDTAKPGHYRTHGEDYISRFRVLVRQWRMATAHLSSSSMLYSNASFLEIVAMGHKAVPLIIEELERQPDLLVAALPMITHEDPVSSDERGDIYAMAVAWIAWHRRRNP